MTSCFNNNYIKCSRRRLSEATNEESDNTSGDTQGDQPACDSQRDDQPR